ncbi:MAG: CBS domain-containing protein [Candidatus Lokiarchaeota archaeon]|nr:CBS domain-containing protein [Candidatus Lokiarchaeota archaeon]
MSSRVRDFPSARDLMTRFVLMLPSTANFGDLIELMYKNRVSAVVINDPETQNYFIVSHTDVIEFLQYSKSQRNDIYNIPLKFIMKSPVEIIDQNISIDKAIHMMNERGFKRLVLGKNGIPTGIISTRDILMWNNKFFRPGKPVMLLVLDNDTSILLAKHIFKENITRGINQSLVEIFGGAIASINSITNEVINTDGKIRILQKDNFTVLFEPRDKITALLVTTNSNIELRRRLFAFVEAISEKYRSLFESTEYKNHAKEEIDILEWIHLFNG